MAPCNAFIGTFGGSRSVRMFSLTHHDECVRLTVVVGECRVNARFMFKRIPDAIASEDEDIQKAH